MTMPWGIVWYPKRRAINNRSRYGRDRTYPEQQDDGVASLGHHAPQLLQDLRLVSLGHFLCRVVREALVQLQFGSSSVRTVSPALPPSKLPSCSTTTTAATATTNTSSTSAPRRDHGEARQRPQLQLLHGPGHGPGLLIRSMNNSGLRVRESRADIYEN